MMWRSKLAFTPFPRALVRGQRTKAAVIACLVGFVAACGGAQAVTASEEELAQQIAGEVYERLLREGYLECVPEQAAVAADRAADDGDIDYSEEAALEALERMTEEPAAEERHAMAEAEEELVYAAHILIAYQGAARADPSTTRTEAQARRHARQLQRRATPDNFADLARAESDGPSGPRGGDLGGFGRRRMHPAFEAGAFGIRVGEIGEVVETPFGFHIIHRYAP